MFIDPGAFYDPNSARSDMYTNNITCHRYAVFKGIVLKL